MKPRNFLKNLSRPTGFRLHHVNELGIDYRADIQRLDIDGDQQVVFDVGANKGQFLKKLKRWFPNSTVHCFEPGPGIDKLTRRSRRYRNMVLNTDAMGSKCRKETFMVNSLWGMSSFLKPGEVNWGKVTEEKEVDVITFDHYCAFNHIDRVSLLKIDTQGYELEVLKGAQEAMKDNCIHMVYLELIFTEIYKGLPRFDEIITFLLDNRFELVAFYEMLSGQRKTGGWTDALFVNPHYTGCG